MEGGWLSFDKFWSYKRFNNVALFLTNAGVAITIYETHLVSYIGATTFSKLTCSITKCLHLNLLLSCSLIPYRNETGTFVNKPQPFVCALLGYIDIHGGIFKCRTRLKMSDRDLTGYELKKDTALLFCFWRMLGLPATISKTPLVGYIGATTFSKLTCSITKRLHSNLLLSCSFIPYRNEQPFVCALLGYIDILGGILKCRTRWKMSDCDLTVSEVKKDPTLLFCFWRMLGLPATIYEMPLLVYIGATNCLNCCLEFIL